jgi:ArsR family transcriptional regulator
MLEEPAGQPAALCCPSIADQPLSDDEAETAAAAFRALADPTRIKLLALIAGAPQEGACVCNLWAMVPLSQPTVSHHLKVLLEAGLVTRQRRGTWAYYRLRTEALASIAGALSPRAGSSVASSGG